MSKPKLVFTVASLLFQPLYLLMLLMYFDQLKSEEDMLARALDIGIISLGVVFMLMQACMVRFVGRPHRKALLRRFFYAGLVVWFLLEVVLSYWWCFVTGADPLMEHTPFVLLFLGLNVAQYRALRALGVLSNPS